ncbi:hypothetical protein F3C99_02930 [Vitellibacter sp. q18]|nr:hypothetical protein [Aequorivita lutea]
MESKGVCPNPRAIEKRIITSTGSLKIEGEKIAWNNFFNWGWGTEGSRCFGYKLYYWWLKIHKSEEDKNPDVSVGGKIKIEGLTAF